MARHPRSILIVALTPDCNKSFWIRATAVFVGRGLNSELDCKVLYSEVQETLEIRRLLIGKTSVKPCNKPDLVNCEDRYVKQPRNMTRSVHVRPRLWLVLTMS